MEASRVPPPATAPRPLALLIVRLEQVLPRLEAFAIREVRRVRSTAKEPQGTKSPG